MSDIKKPTGIIYRAYNTISGKSYVGKTVRGLSIRKKEHLKRAETQLHHKFANALRRYPESSWQWTVLLEVEIDKLDACEQLFIQHLDTLNNGYNTFLNRYSENKEYKHHYNHNEIYELYHCEYGEVSGTRNELRQIDENLVASLSLLVSGKKIRSYKGWVLLENKDIYEAILTRSDTITLTHKEHGTLTLQRPEFEKRFGLSSGSLTLLKKGILKSSKGWTLPENKESYQQPIDILTLTHPEYGTHTLTRKEFKKQFNLARWGLSKLAKGKRKSYAGWKLVKEK
jgi:hypothetical protein